MTRTKTCQEVLLEHFNAQPNTWIKKVQFYVIAEDWSPETVGRELRTLEEDPKSGITVSYYKGKYASNLAQYLKGTPPVKEIPRVICKDGVAYVI